MAYIYIHQHLVGKYLDLPFVCKICAFSPKKTLPKGRNFTYLEDPGIPYMDPMEGWKMASNRFFFVA